MNRNLIDYYTNKLNDSNITESEREIYKNKLHELKGYKNSKPNFKSLFHTNSKAPKSEKSQENLFYQAAMLSSGEKQDFLLNAGIQYEILSANSHLNEEEKIIQSLILADL